MYTFIYNLNSKNWNKKGRVNYFPRLTYFSNYPLNEKKEKEKEKGKGKERKLYQLQEFPSRVEVVRISKYPASYRWTRSERGNSWPRIEKETS